MHEGRGPPTGASPSFGGAEEAPTARLARLIIVPAATQRAALEGLSCATSCRSPTLRLLGCGSVAQGINQQGKGGCRLPTAWIIEVVSCERRAPGCEHPDELAAIEVSPHLLLGEIR